MKNSLLISAFVVFILAFSYSYAQDKIQVQTPAYVNVSQTAGFLVGQRYSLERIKTEFPDLASRAQIAEMEFNASFQKAEKAITEELRVLLKDKYSEYEKNLKIQIRDNLTKQALTHEVASNFIAEISDRTKGAIPSPILETLLNYQYKDNPEEEFSREYIHTFSTKSHLKAKGIELTFSYPVSWKSAESERPNIIHKFISENGNGPEMFVIMVKDLPIPAGYVITPQELDEFFTESELREILPENSKFISAKPVILDNHKAGVILFDQTVQRLDITKILRAQMYVTVVKNKMVLLQFMVTHQEGNSLQTHFDKFEPLFKMVANSFIIQNQYSEADYVSTASATPVNSVTLNSKKKVPSVFFNDNLILSLIITWSIGLTPPLLIRFLIWRKPLKKWSAIGISSGFWLINLAILVGLLESRSKSHFALFLIAYVSYNILRSGESKTAQNG